jgi:hypothetical protein
VAIQGARAARTPLATAALCPLRKECRNTRNVGSELLSPASTAAVSSVLPSSMKIISYERVLSAASISRASGSTFSASLQTGTTTESSTLILPSAHRAPRRKDA